MIVKAKFTSVWDGGIKVTTDCFFDTTTHKVVESDQVDIEGVDTLDEQYVTLEDGTELHPNDGDDDWENVEYTVSKPH